MRNANSQQKEKYLPKLLTGEHMPLTGALACTITEHNHNSWVYMGASASSRMLGTHALELAAGLGEEPGTFVLQHQVHNAEWGFCALCPLCA